jgi:hypothetical protein
MDHGHRCATSREEIVSGHQAQTPKDTKAHFDVRHCTRQLRMQRRLQTQTRTPTSGGRHKDEPPPFARDVEATAMNMPSVGCRGLTISVGCASSSLWDAERLHKMQFFLPEPGTGWGLLSHTRKQVSKHASTPSNVIADVST